MNEISDDAALNDTNALRLRVAALKEFVGGDSTKKTARKARERLVRAAVDGRTLRSKGRTVQLNFKVTPEIKEALDARVEAEDTTIADLMEAVLKKLLKAKVKR
jgi:hypothetical protein